MPILVLSADEAKDSDVSKLIHGWKVKYQNVCLPKWKDRIHSQAYLETQVTKGPEIRIKSAVCPYRKLHRKELLKNTTDLPVQDGPHCSLSDVNNLYRHLQINNMWNLLSELRRYAGCPHKSEAKSSKKL